MKELVTYLVKSLVEDCDSVEVTENVRGNFIDVTVTVPQGDMGKIIGKQGRIAKAIRAVVKAASQKTGKKCNVEICEKQG
ncbi:MAG: KH domain-containing protein [Clostridia bacterium]|nr:KH domain-containing protein [Clostridia bacterium]